MIDGEPDEAAPGDTASSPLFPPRKPCSWCGVREASEAHTVYASPTCEVCHGGGRHLRVKNYINRLRWAAEGKQ